jgi:hypothetical protein
VFGPRSEEVKEKWRKRHELNDLFSSRDIVRGIKLREMRFGRACSMYGGGRGLYRRNLKEGNHLEDWGRDGSIIVKIDLQEVECGGMDWIELAQDKDRLQAHENGVLNPRVA